jgi:hypothetical protein
VFHVLEAAVVVAVKITVCPLQILGLLTAMVGVAVTLTVIVAFAVHVPTDPFNVYVVFPNPGFTLIVLVLGPVLHVYVPAVVVAVSTMGVPEQ